MFSKSMAILLGIIQQQPVNAYELNKMLSAMNVRSWYPIAASTVYATLKAAEKKGYISGDIEKSGNMPEKTIYALTGKGQAAFLETLQSFIAEFEYDITPFSIAIFFIKALEKDTAISLLKERMNRLEKYQQGLEEQIKKMKHEKIPELFILNTQQNRFIVEAQLKGVRLILPIIEQ